MTDTASPPDTTDLDRLRRAAAACTACDLHRSGTQTVFGAGGRDAAVVFVGEQPGDEEDQEGEPFVGPAGRELDRGLGAVGIDRDAVWITNVVKHFKWSERRGKRRIHDKPNRIEIDACLPWMRAEVAALQPEIIVALGATAAQALLGSDFRVTRQRGELHPGPGRSVITATVHPSSILRSPGDDQRHAARQDLHDDLRVVATLVSDGPAAALERTGTKASLYRRAQQLGVAGRSRMDKPELATAIAEWLTTTDRVP